jgi:hypothetical protein
VGPAASGMRRAKCAKRTQFLPPGAGDGADGAKRSQTWVDWGIWAKAVVVWGVARPGSETCKTNPIWGRGGPRLRIGDCGLWIERRRPGADAGGKMRKTNPIWPRPERVTEQTVRNEAKLGGTGVCGQRQSPCGPWLGRGAKCTKRTQFGGPGAQDYGLKGAGRDLQARASAGAPESGVPESPRYWVRSPVRFQALYSSTRVSWSRWGTGPREGVACRYSTVGSWSLKTGHGGKPAPLGFPVLAKLVQ